MKRTDATVLVVDDDPRVRAALDSLLRSAGLRVVTFASVAMLTALPRDEAAGCLVLDVRLPGVGGLEFLGQLHNASDALPVIMITGHGDISMSVRAMKAGAIDFLAKPFTDDELLDAIDNALERDRYRREHDGALEAIRTRHALLTTREREVLDGLLGGLLNKQIAAELGLSEVTVKVHRSRMMRKMAVRSVVELVRNMERLGGGAGSPRDTKV